MIEITRQRAAAIAQACEARANALDKEARLPENAGPYLASKRIDLREQAQALREDSRRLKDQLRAERELGEEGFKLV